MGPGPLVTHRGRVGWRGAGRGLPRQEGETEEAYRARASRVSQNAITPNGIVRAVNEALGFEGATLVEYWDFGFYWGHGYWGHDYWARGLHAIVFVPQGSDLVSLQALVNEIRLPTIFIRVLARAT